MRWETVFALICGYEQIGDQLRLYLDGPLPEPCFTRSRGVRAPLFHLYAGQDAEAIWTWLARNRAWQCLRVPPEYTAEQGVQAVLIASEWHCGELSAMFRFARSRTIRSEADRDRPRKSCPRRGAC